ncbi:hypothetical protein D3C76_1512630 [compost metagenome]
MSGLEYLEGFVVGDDRRPLVESDSKHPPDQCIHLGIPQGPHHIRVSSSVLFFCDDSEAIFYRVVGFAVANT